MPAKPCPSCGLKNPESSTTCDCGYQFSDVRVTRTGELLCPSCGSRCSPKASSCDCGHSFGEDTEDVRHMLTHRLTLGWFGVVGGLLMVLAAVGLALLSFYARTGRTLLPTGLFIAGCVFIVRGVRSVTRARAGLETLGARPAAPPKARVLKK